MSVRSAGLNRFAGRTEAPTEVLRQRIEVLDDHHQTPEAGGLGGLGAHVRAAGDLDQLEDRGPESAEAHPRSVGSFENPAK